MVFRQRTNLCIIGVSKEEKLNRTELIFLKNIVNFLEIKICIYIWKGPTMINSVTNSNKTIKL